MQTEKHYMTEEEEQAHYEAEADSNMRYIRAKLPVATPKHLALLAAAIRGMGIIGWARQEDE